MKSFVSGDLMLQLVVLPPATLSHVSLQMEPSTSFPALARLSRCCKAFSLLLLSSARWNSCESPRCRMPTPSRSSSPPPRCLLPIKRNAWVIPHKSHGVTSATCWCCSLTSGVWPFLAKRRRAQRPVAAKEKKELSACFGGSVWTDVPLVWREVSVEQLCWALYWRPKKPISWFILNGRFLFSMCLYQSPKVAAAAATQDVEWMLG